MGWLLILEFPFERCITFSCLLTYLRSFVILFQRFHLICTLLLYGVPWFRVLGGTCCGVAGVCFDLGYCLDVFSGIVGNCLFGSGFGSVCL